MGKTRYRTKEAQTLKSGIVLPTQFSEERVDRREVLKWLLLFGLGIGSTRVLTGCSNRVPTVTVPLGTTVDLLNEKVKKDYGDYKLEVSARIALGYYIDPEEGRILEIIRKLYYIGTFLNENRMVVKKREANSTVKLPEPEEFIPPDYYEVDLETVGERYKAALKAKLTLVQLTDTYLKFEVPGWSFYVTPLQ